MTAFGSEEYRWRHDFKVIPATAGLLVWTPFDDGEVTGPWPVLAIGVVAESVEGPGVVESWNAEFKGRTVRRRTLSASSLQDGAISYENYGPATFLLLANSDWEDPWIEIGECCWSEAAAVVEAVKRKERAEARLAIVKDEARA